MNGIKISWKSELGKVQKQLRKASRQKFKKASDLAKSRLREAAPVDTGNLKKSVKANTYDYAALVGFTAPHAHLLELGHEIVSWGKATGKRQPPNPFFEKAWMSIIPELKAIISEEIAL